MGCAPGVAHNSFPLESLNKRQTHTPPLSLLLKHLPQERGKRSGKKRLLAPSNEELLFVAHLHRHVAVVVVCDYGSDPSPIESYCQLRNGFGLVDVTGHGPEEGGVLAPVTQAGTAGRVAHLKDRQTG